MLTYNVVVEILVNLLGVGRGLPSVGRALLPLALRLLARLRGLGPLVLLGQNHEEVRALLALHEPAGDRQ